MEVAVDWAVLIFITFLLVSSVIVAVRKPSKESLEAVKSCLLNWVVQAEAVFGSGTGKVKLSEVYSEFIATFPDLAKSVSQETFSQLVDESLDQMREMIRVNPSLRNAMGLEEGAKV